MIFPSRRLLWLAALVLLPACALPLLRPDGVTLLLGVAALVMAVAAADALWSWPRLAPYVARSEADLRITLGVECALPVDILFTAKADAGARKGQLKQARVALALPPELDGGSNDLRTEPPAPSFRVVMTLLGRERGEFTLRQIYLGTPSHLGLWEMRRTLAVATRVLVQPSLKQTVGETAKLLASRRHGGRRLIPRTGRGREFEQLREYAPGDDTGDIDWKATARRHAPMVRQYQIERTQDIYVCVDASRLSAQAVARTGGERATVLDEFVRATLMLEYAIGQDGDRFGLATFSDRVHHFVKASAGRSHDRTLRLALYPLRSRMVAPAFDEICATLRVRVRRRALMIFLTSLAEPQLANAFAAASSLLARQHVVVVASPADPRTQPLFSHDGIETSEELYGELAGHLLWKRLVEIRARLAQSGIRMQTVAPGRLGAVATAAYLDVKERQLL